MSQIRTFVAIPLSSQIRSHLEDVLRSLRSLSCDVKWVRPEAIHLTLKFLGYVEETVIADIARAVQGKVEPLRPWSVRVRTMGTFPSLRNPRVVWIGLDDPSGQILQVQEQIEEGICRLGFARETRAFTPHLTLGRVRSARGKQDLVSYLIDTREIDLGSFEVNRIVLYRSDLRPAGAVYTELREFILKSGT